MRLDLRPLMSCIAIIGIAGSLYAYEPMKIKGLITFNGQKVSDVDLSIYTSSGNQIKFEELKNGEFLIELSSDTSQILFIYKDGYNPYAVHISADFSDIDSSDAEADFNVKIHFQLDTLHLAMLKAKIKEDESFKETAIFESFMTKKVRYDNKTHSFEQYEAEEFTQFRSLFDDPDLKFLYIIEKLDQQLSMVDKVDYDQIDLLLKNTEVLKENYDVSYDDRKYQESIVNEGSNLEKELQKWDEAITRLEINKLRDELKTAKKKFREEINKKLNGAKHIKRNLETSISTTQSLLEQSNSKLISIKETERQDSIQNAKLAKEKEENSKKKSEAVKVGVPADEGYQVINEEFISITGKKVLKTTVKSNLSDEYIMELEAEIFQEQQSEITDAQDPDQNINAELSTSDLNISPETGLMHEGILEHSNLNNEKDTNPLLERLLDSIKAANPTEYYAMIAAGNIPAQKGNDSDGLLSVNFNPDHSNSTQINRLSGKTGEGGSEESEIDTVRINSLQDYNKLISDLKQEGSKKELQAEQESTEPAVLNIEEVKHDNEAFSYEVEVEEKKVVLLHLAYESGKSDLDNYSKILIQEKLDDLRLDHIGNNRIKSINIYGHSDLQRPKTSANFDYHNYCLNANLRVNSNDCLGKIRALKVKFLIHMYIAKNSELFQKDLATRISEVNYDAHFLLGGVDKLMSGQLLLDLGYTPLVDKTLEWLQVPYPETPREINAIRCNSSIQTKIVEESEMFNKLATPFRCVVIIIDYEK